MIENFVGEYLKFIIEAFCCTRCSTGNHVAEDYTSVGEDMLSRISQESDPASWLYDTHIEQL